MHGSPTYIELCVEDADKARTFFGGLLDWQTSGDSGPGQAATGGLDIGIHDKDSSSLLEVFFAVHDLDETLVKLGDLGGSVFGGIHAENMAFGRWIECQDDQGVRFGLRELPS